MFILFEGPQHRLLTLLYPHFSQKKQAHSRNDNINSCSNEMFFLWRKNIMFDVPSKQTSWITRNSVLLLLLLLLPSSHTARSGSRVIKFPTSSDPRVSTVTAKANISPPRFPQPNDTAKHAYCVPPPAPFLCFCTFSFRISYFYRKVLVPRRAFPPVFFSSKLWEIVLYIHIYIHAWLALFNSLLADQAKKYVYHAGACGLRLVSKRKNVPSRRVSRSLFQKGRHAVYMHAGILSKGSVRCINVE